MALLLLLSRTSRFWTIICVGNQFEHNGPSWWEPIPPAVKAHSLTAHCTGVLRYLKSQRLNISSQNIRGRIPVLEVTSVCWDQVINQYHGEVISRKINKPLSDLDHDDCWAVTYRCYTAHLQACVSMEGKRLNKYDYCAISTAPLTWYGVSNTGCCFLNCWRLTLQPLIVLISYYIIRYIIGQITVC